jgi:teichuronic acid biosynthesis glycosyltransferase TuaC
MTHSQTQVVKAGRQSAGPLHILTITPFYPAEGDEARGCFIAEPLAALSRLNVHNTVMAVEPFYRGRAKASQTAPEAEWERFFPFPGAIGLPTSGAFLFASLLAKVRRIHGLQSIHLIHAHAALPCGHAAALLSRQLGIPFVVTVHGLDAYFTNQVSGLFGQWCKRVSSWVYRSAHKVICISQKVRDQVVLGTKASTVVIYNGVDPEMFSPSPGIGKGAPILSVGNLIPIKGHELLLRAIAEVRQEFPQVSCDLIGDGPERPRLEMLARDLGIGGNIHFLGRKNRGEVAAAMSRCVLFALPSRYEGLGCVYLEAMSSAKPVIACAGQGIEEVIQHGHNGWLNEPGSLPDMTFALTQLLRDPHTCLQLGEAARRTIIDRFTLAHQAEMLAQLYQGCVA